MTHSNYNGFIFFENDFYYNFFTQEFLLKIVLNKYKSFFFFFFDFFPLKKESLELRFEINLKIKFFFRQKVIFLSTIPRGYKYYIDYHVNL